MNIPRPRGSNRPLPRPRRPHPTEQAHIEAEQAEASPTQAAIGEVALNAEQVRLRDMVKSAEAAAAVLQEATGDNETEVYFEPVKGKAIREKAVRDKSQELAEAVETLGITDNVDAELLYAFPSEGEPTGVTLGLSDPEQDTYTVIQVAKLESLGGTDVYRATIESARDTGFQPISSMSLDKGTSLVEREDKPEVTNPATDEEMAEYKRMMSAQGGHGEVMSEDLQGELAEHLAERAEETPEEARELTSTEVGAAFLVNQAILDLQPPLD